MSFYQSVCRNQQSESFPLSYHNSTVCQLQIDHLNSMRSSNRSSVDTHVDNVDCSQTTAQQTTVQQTADEDMPPLEQEDTPPVAQVAASWLSFAEFAQFAVAQIQTSSQEANRLPLTSKAIGDDLRKAMNQFSLSGQFRVGFVFAPPQVKQLLVSLQSSTVDTYTHNMLRPVLCLIRELQISEATPDLEVQRMVQVKLVWFKDCCESLYARDRLGFQLGVFICESVGSDNSFFNHPKRGPAAQLSTFYASVRRRWRENLKDEGLVNDPDLESKRFQETFKATASFIAGIIWRSPDPCRLIHCTKMLQTFDSALESVLPGVV